MPSLREDLYAYAETKYHSRPEYLWARYPDYAIFRHGDNNKWFGLIMDVPRNKLGGAGEDRVDILNVKMESPLLVDLLVQLPGYLRGYHIRRGNWISILLDGTVPLAEICQRLDESYQNTAPKAKKRSKSVR